VTDRAAADGWTAKMTLKTGTTRIEATATSPGTSEDFDIDVTAGTTAGWAAGKYEMFLTTEKGAEKYVECRRQVEVLPDPLGTGESNGTTLEADLVLVDAAITAVLSGAGVQSYTLETQVGRRQVERMSLADLRAHRGWLLEQINAERVRRGSQKNTAWRRHGVKFAN